MALCRSSLLRSAKPIYPRDLYQPASRPRDPLDVVRQLNDIKRVQRQNGTLKRVYQLQRREFPGDRRRWDRIDEAYWKKWHYLKYCTNVISYSMERGLRFRGETEEAVPEKVWADAKEAPIVKPSPLASGKLAAYMPEKPREYLPQAKYLPHGHQESTKGEERDEVAMERRLRSMLAKQPRTSREPE
mmetsp:Transcript_19408/g.43695  ORF Transcript_19408/g.43695 Transcript_19408/m.43695 type:complete len:187 (-) Transcript_19408:36-596(-)